MLKMTVRRMISARSARDMTGFPFEAARTGFRTETLRQFGSSGRIGIDT